MVIDNRVQSRFIEIEFEVIGYETNLDYRIDNLVKKIQSFIKTEDMSDDIKIVLTIR